jgi:hypothetical protein
MAPKELFGAQFRFIDIYIYIFSLSFTPLITL